VRQRLSRLGPRPILHIQYQAGAFDLGGWVNLLPIWIRGTLPRARVVTTFHDFRVPYLFPKAGPARLAANRLLARTSHAAIFAEPADLTSAGAGVRGHLIPIGSNVDCAPPADFDRATARARLGADRSTLLIGYFGFANQSKGGGSLLAALGKLVQTGRDARLVFVGAQAGSSDPTDAVGARELRRLIDVNGLCDRVAYTGYLTPSEVSANLLACDVIAQPYVDGASLRRGTLMAAVAHGMPIVSTMNTHARGDAAGLPQLRDGENLLLVPPGDGAALADAIERLADDAELCDRLRIGARAFADQIAWPTIARATLDVYRESA
jgi:glycosyltransferase involved in cell wall biosynthesis